VVLPRELIDVIPDLLAYHPLRSLPAYLSVVAGVLLIADRKSRFEVSLNVLVLAAVGFGVDHEALTIGVDLGAMGARIAGVRSVAITP
jgi:hypothetical protein